MSPVKTAFATGGADGSGTGGGTSDGSQNLSDGASEMKTGYIIYASDADGNPTSPVVARTTYGNTPTSSSGTIIDMLTARFGSPHTEEQYDGNTIVWGTPPLYGFTGINRTQP